MSGHFAVRRCQVSEKSLVPRRDRVDRSGEAVIVEPHHLGIEVEGLDRPGEAVRGAQEVPIVAIVPLIAGGSGFQTARDEFRSHANSMQVFFEIAGEDSRVKPNPPRWPIDPLRTPLTHGETLRGKGRLHARHLNRGDAPRNFRDKSGGNSRLTPRFAPDSVP